MMLTLQGLFVIVVPAVEVTASGGAAAGFDGAAEDVAVNAGGDGAHEVLDFDVYNVQRGLLVLLLVHSFYDMMLIVIFHLRLQMYKENLKPPSFFHEYLMKNFK